MAAKVGGIVENGQNTKKRPGYLRRLPLLNSRERPAANAGVKNSQGIITIIIIIIIIT